MSSVYSDILNQAVAEIDAVRAALSIDGYPVGIRKKASWMQQSDIMPRIVVVGTRDELVDEALDGQVQIAYEVFVAIFNPQNAPLSDQTDDQVRSLRQAIRKRLHKPVLTLAGSGGGPTATCNVTLDLNPSYPGQGIVDGGYEPSALMFKWWVAEERN